MSEDGRERAIALALAGLGGAPGKAGHVYVVLVPENPGDLSLRAAVLLASADLVVTDMPLEHPALGLAASASIEVTPIGQAIDPGDYVVVRAVLARKAAEAPGLVDELAGLDRAGIPFEIEPPPRSAGSATVLTAWNERLPLRGRRVLVARSRRQASALSMHVRSLGGEPIEAPVIEVTAGDLGHLDEAVQDVADGAFKAIFLTSPNGVDAVADAAGRSGLDARIFDRVGQVACVGPGTASRLQDRLGVRADVIPDTFTTTALGESIARGSGHVLLPRADLATPELPRVLRELGYEPVEVIAYRTRPVQALRPEVVQMLEAGEIDVIALASSSTARNFARLVEELEWKAAVASIGPVTSATAREVGLDVTAEATRHDIDGLVEAVCWAARR